MYCEKSKLIKKQLLFLLVFSLSLFIFAGCQSKSAVTTSSSNKTNKSINIVTMKQKMQNSIKPLVANKTITQAQEDKIVTALTTTNSQRSKSGQTNGTKGAKINKQLTKLVSDKVITQAQANAVTKAINVITTKPTKK
jgi:predicted PurR-regulated permease PerM